MTYQILARQTGAPLDYVKQVSRCILGNRHRATDAEITMIINAIQQGMNAKERLNKEAHI